MTYSTMNPNIYNVLVTTDVRRLCYISGNVRIYYALIVYLLSRRPGHTICALAIRMERNEPMLRIPYWPLSLEVALLRRFGQNRQTG